MASFRASFLKLALLYPRKAVGVAAAEGRLTPFPVSGLARHVRELLQIEHIKLMSSNIKVNTKLSEHLHTMAPKRKAIPEDAANASSPASPKSTKKVKAEKPEAPETETSGWVLQWPNLLLSK